jgi:hypothetical protein
MRVSRSVTLPLAKAASVHHLSLPSGLDRLNGSPFFLYLPRENPRFNLRSPASPRRCASARYVHVLWTCTHRNGPGVAAVGLSLMGMRAVLSNGPAADRSSGGRGAASPTHWLWTGRGRLAVRWWQRLARSWSARCQSHSGRCVPDH